MNTNLLKFESAQLKWWNKPLVRYNGQNLPAELVVLSMELQTGEYGVWMNSKGMSSGVRDLVCAKQNGAKKFRTRRQDLPEFVTEMIKQSYRAARVKKGCPDLVIWKLTSKQLRLVEVKCPHWDKPTPEQERFMLAAISLGISTKIVEWEFR